MEDQRVGGAPFFARTFQRFLPKTKKKRELLFRIQAFVITYITYSVFNGARRPLAVMKLKVIEECNLTHLRDMNNTTSNEWCEDTLIASSTEELMGFLDSAFIGVYGVSF